MAAAEEGREQGSRCLSLRTKPWLSPWIIMIVAIYVFALPWMASAIVVRYWINEDFSRLAGIGKTMVRRVFMVAHMSLGALCLLLGPIQFLPIIRHRAPTFHRWSGRVYILSALLCSIFGLIFICLKGFYLVGGINMGLAFTTAGSVFGFCAFKTAERARAHDFVAHRNWSIRAYSQVLSPMLYRYFYVVLFALGGYDFVENDECDDKDVCQVFLRTFDAVHAWTYFIVPLFFAELVVWCLPKETNESTKGAHSARENSDPGEQQTQEQLEPERDTEAGSGERLPSGGSAGLPGIYGPVNILGLFAAVCAVGCTALIFATPVD